MNIFHNENCKKLFDITNEYGSGKITAEEAKDRYSKCDLSYKNKLDKAIVKTIDSVYRSTRKKAAREKVVEEKVVKEISEDAVGFSAE
jgi:hypothetical protein